MYIYILKQIGMFLIFNKIEWTKIIPEASFDQSFGQKVPQDLF